MAVVLLTQLLVLGSNINASPGCGLLMSTSSRSFNPSAVCPNLQPIH